MIALARRATPAATGEAGAPGEAAATQAALAALAAEAHFRQGLALLARGRRRAALDEVAAAARWCPDDPVYLFHLGLAHHRLGRWEDAMAAYERAWQVRPSFRTAYHHALAALQAGTHLSPESWTVLRERLWQAGEREGHACRIARLEAWRHAAAAAVGPPAGAPPEDPVSGPVAAEPSAASSEESSSNASGVDSWGHQPDLPSIIRAEVGLFRLAAGDPVGAAAALRQAWAAADRLPAPHRIAVLGALVLAEARWGRAAKTVAVLEESGGLPLGQTLPILPTARDAPTPAEALAAREAERFLAWAVTGAGWEFWQRGSTEAARVWERGARLLSDPAELLHHVALVRENATSWQEAQEAWEAYVRALQADRKQRDVRDERAWRELLIAQAYLHMAREARDRQETVEAAWLGEALRFGGREPEVRLEVAALAAYFDDPPLVKSALAPLRHEAAGRPELARRMARLFEEAGLTDEARGAWDLILKADPGDDEARRAIAQATAREVKARLTESTAKGGPGRPGSLRALWRDAEHAARLAPEDARIWAALCALALAERQLEAARQYLQRAQALNVSPEDVGFIGRMALEAGEEDLAASLFKQAIDMGGPALLVSVGMHLVDLGRVDEGFRRVQSGCRGLGYPVELCLNVALHLVEVGRPDLGIRLMRAVTRRHPRAARPWIVLARCYLETQELTKARDAFRKAMKLAEDGGDDEILDGLIHGWLLVELLAEEQSAAAQELPSPPERRSRDERRAEERREAGKGVSDRQGGRRLLDLFDSDGETEVSDGRERSETRRRRRGEPS